MTNLEKKFHFVAKAICGKQDGLSAYDCFKSKGANNPSCKGHGRCRVEEKTEQQLQYITHPLTRNSFLEACPGSGKTEVVGMKAAFEISQWLHAESGITILTFTNNAADIIKDRIIQFTNITGSFYPHFIGTIDSWLHGYIGNPLSHMKTGYEGVNGDKSFRVVDISSKATFLNSFRTKYGYGKRGNINANQYYFDPENKKFEFLSSDRALDEQRNNINFENWQLNDLKNTKKRFWKAGFVTFQDVEFLCFKILKDEISIRNRIAARFPVVIVDEFQDLSWVQMEILRFLKDSGTYLHFAGDLNQAIYAFKKVYPEKVKKFTNENNFLKLSLTQNFRSLQPIVNLCCNIVRETKKIKGQPYNKTKPVCLLLLYKLDELKNLPIRFVNYIRRDDLDIKKSAILARGQSMVCRLRPGLNPKIQNKSFLPALAINLWRSSNWEAKKEALNCMGKFISMICFGNVHLDSKNQYRPEKIESNIEWRLFLSKIINSCIFIKNLADLNANWSDWATLFRKYFPDVLYKYSGISFANKINLDSMDWYRAPRNLGNKKVISSLETISTSQDVGIRITTIHQAKGETLDAVMLVSQPTKQGTDGGHWEQWLNDREEHTRFAFVASTRPKNLLIWAISERDKNKIHRLSEIGFEFE